MNKKAVLILPLLLSLLLLGSIFVTSVSSSITVNANLQASSIDVANEVNEIIIPFETLSLNLRNIDSTNEPVTVKFKVTNNKTDTLYTETHKYESASNKKLDISHVAIRADTIGKNAFPVAGESTKMTVSVKSTHPDVSSDLASRELTISRNIDNTSCSSILSTNNGASSGIYTISPSGNPIEVYCDMDTRGGGWTKINASTARTMVNKNGGGLEAKQNTFDKGFDGNKPYFQSRSTGPGGGMEYDINTGFEFDQMYLENVGFKSTSYKSDSSDTSEYVASSYQMNSWEYTGGGPNNFKGDIGFGVPADSGPTTTYTDAGGSFGSNSGVTDFPFNIDTSNGQLFNVTSDITLRIAASESGGQEEGWRWEKGSIYVK